MHEAFAIMLMSWNRSFERLLAMKPVTITTMAKDAPSECIYLFSENETPLYVGRTRHLRQRMRQHSIPASQHNQAVFAFRLARQATGHLEATYDTAASRATLCKDIEFAAEFSKAKVRVRQMQVRYVEERDPLRQALLEIYVAVVLKTPYNDFNTH